MAKLKMIVNIGVGGSRGGGTGASSSVNHAQDARATFKCEVVKSLGGPIKDGVYDVERNHAGTHYSAGCHGSP